jgi:UDP-N-acetylmuramate--alanine ligase
VNGQKLFEETKKNHPDAVYVPDKNELAGEILKRAKSGDLVITMGAGDITYIGRSVATKLTA